MRQIGGAPDVAARTGDRAEPLAADRRDGDHPLGIGPDEPGQRLPRCVEKTFPLGGIVEQPTGEAYASATRLQQQLFVAIEKALGKKAIIERCRKDPLARAFRIDKLQRAALEATLEAHLRAPVPMDVPTVAMLHAPQEALEQRATWMAEQLGAPAVAEPCSGLVGGGALPGVDLPSWAVALPVSDAELLARRLREGDPPVIGRVEGGRCLLDLRTVPPSQDAELVDLVLAALG